MRTIHLMGALATAFFFAGQTMATPIIPEGTVITGDPASLIGFDASLNDYLAGGTSAVNDLNIEFLTDDFALGIDFGSDGLLRLWDNLGSGEDLFNYSLRFTFTDLNGLSAIQNLDLSGLAGGDLLFNVIDGNTFELALRDVQFSPGFSHADLGLSVDEPPALALFAPGLAIGLIAAYLTRRRRLVLGAAVAP